MVSVGVRVYHVQRAEIIGFTDVAADSPYAQAIAALRSQGVLTGNPDGTFGPQETLNRAEFTAIVVRTRVPAEAIDTCLQRHPVLPSDVPRGMWFAPYICSAKVNGYMGGYPDGTIRPARAVTFAEAAKVTAVAFGSVQRTDAVWYAPYVRFLADRGAIPLTIEGVTDELTRAELAEIIYRLRAQIADRPSQGLSLLAGASQEETHAAALPASSDASSLLLRINDERRSRGLWNLQWSVDLATAAEYHARDMVARGFYDHASPDGETVIGRIRRLTTYLSVDLATCNCRSWTYRYGENIMRGTADEAMAFWMNSAVHRGNILSREYTDVGVGRSGPYWVLVFGGKFFER